MNSKLRIAKVYNIIIVISLVSSIKCFEGAPNSEMHYKNETKAINTIETIIAAANDEFSINPDDGYNINADFYINIIRKLNELTYLGRIGDGYYINNSGYNFVIYTGVIAKAITTENGKKDISNYFIIYAWPAFKHSGTRWYFANSLGELSIYPVLMDWNIPNKWDYKLTDGNNNNRLDSDDKINWNK